MFARLLVLVATATLVLGLAGGAATARADLTEAAALIVSMGDDDDGADEDPVPAEIGEEQLSDAPPPEGWMIPPRRSAGPAIARTSGGTAPDVGGTLDPPPRAAAASPRRARAAHG